MGTRADFYVGRGLKAEWIGSIGWDGYPKGIPDPVLQARTEPAFRSAVAEMFAKRDDVTIPEQGWPWPWENSRVTDFAYSFSAGRVRASYFGRSWIECAGRTGDAIDADVPYQSSRRASVTFPDMSARKAVTYGKRSGVIMVTAGGIVR